MLENIQESEESTMPTAEKKPRTWGGLSEQEISKAPWFIRYIARIKYFNIGVLVLLGLGLLLGFLTRGAAEPLSRVLFLLALVAFFWFVLQIWIVQIGFLVHALKNKEIGYFVGVLLLGPLVWRAYINRCIKPRLARMTGTTSS